MNIVHSGGRYQIYGSSMETYSGLPVRTYELCFDKMSGFYLSDHEDLIVNQAKIYGSTEQKVEKVLKSFNSVDRNFGIILSGAKGIGKSLFARRLAMMAKSSGLPIIIANTYFPGIADFISSIRQEVVVIFDEFEKSFKDTDDFSPQEELLPMFDGIDCGKKLFVITCNDTEMLNECLLNRPGRFHYHFVFECPRPDDIRTYMKDVLLPEHHEIIDKIISFSSYSEMTYDVLRAIAFEINMGYSLEETLQDLNISHDITPVFDLVIELACGEKAYAEFVRPWHGTPDRSRQRAYCYTDSGCEIRVEYKATDVQMDNDGVSMTIDPKRVKIRAVEDDYDLKDDLQANIFADVRDNNLKSVKFTRRSRAMDEHKYTV